MRYSIKDSFGNDYQFTKEELIDAARNGRIEPDALVFDMRKDRSAYAKNIPELKKAFDEYDLKKESEAREKERAKREKEREKAAREAWAQAQKEEDEKKRRAERDDARRQAEAEAERRASEENARRDAEDRANVEKYGSVEIGRAIEIEKKNACAALNFWKLFLETTVLITIAAILSFALISALWDALRNFGAPAPAYAALRDFGAPASDAALWDAFDAPPGNSDSPSVVSAMLAGLGAGVVNVFSIVFFIGIVVYVVFVGSAPVVVAPVFWIVRYLQLTAKRQAALIRLNELYERARRLRAENAEKDARSSQPL